MAYRFSPVGVVGLTASVAGLVMGGCSPQNNTSAVPSPSPAFPTTSGTQSLSESSATPSLVVSPTEPQPPPSAAPSSPTAKVHNPTLLHKIKHDLSEKVAIAKQDTGKTYLSNLLLSQQAEKLVRGQFSGDLKHLSPDFPTETDEYRLEIRQADASLAVLVAVAKRPGYASYTGAVYAIDGKIPMTGMCKTNVPSQTPPQAPKRVDTTLMCPSGSTAVN